MKMQRCVVTGWLLFAIVGAQIVFPDSNRGGGGNSGGNRNSGFDPCRLCPCNGGTLNIPCPTSCCSNSINRPIPNNPRPPNVNRPSSCSAGCFQCFRPGQGQTSCGQGCCRNTFVQTTVAPVQATCPAGCFRCNQFFAGQEAPCFSGSGCCRRQQNQNNQNALILPQFPTNPTLRPTTPPPQTPTTSRPTRPVTTSTARPTTPPTTTPRTTTTTRPTTTPKSTTTTTTTTTTPLPTTPRPTTPVPDSCRQGQCAPCSTPSRIDEFICGSSCCIITSSNVTTTQAPPVTIAPTCSAGCFSCNVPIPGVQTSCGQQGCCRNIPQPTSAPASNQCAASCSPCDSPTIVDQITCGFSCCIKSGRLNADVNQLFGGKEYHFSWLHDGNQKYTQQQAANYCARLSGGWSIISIETRGEDNFVNNIISTNRLDYIWTGATRTASGWRWPSGGAFQQLNWSPTGGAGIPQPDNREPGGENCLAVLNNVYDDGVRWHDIGCNHPKPTICER